jgi:hypothetical protein
LLMDAFRFAFWRNHSGNMLRNVYGDNQVFRQSYRADTTCERMFSLASRQVRGSNSR